MMGSGDLGMGISITLIDDFSGPGKRVVQGFTTIEDATTRLGAKSFLLNQFQQGLGMLEGALNKLTGPGEGFDQNLSELSALTGIAGEGLTDIGDRAINLAKTFGGDAVVGVDTFTNILSKLGPEVAQNSAALQGMGADAFTLSKMMKNDLMGATTALTTSMNIYAGSMTDPAEMQAEMTRQMNAMAAGAAVGSAEVLDIAASIRTGGLAAKSAGVSFEELNALIQIMGKGTIYGAEAGVALRNVFGKLSKGEFMPKHAMEGLKAAGIDLKLLGDISVPIEQRLREIAKIQNNAGLITAVFGEENSNAFRVLAENIDLMGGPDGWVARMTDTNDATEQAAVVMQSYGEKLRRARAWIQGYAIDMFMATKSVLPFVQGTLSMAQGLVALAPAYILAQEGMAAFRATSFMTSIANIGLTATFEALAVAVWTALAPLVPFIAIAAGVVAVIWLAHKGMESFQDLMAGGEVEGGFWGVIQQIGGVITGIIEVFKSWDGATFSMSENMRANLEKIGVLDFVLTLATWTVRIIEFFKGAGEAVGDFVSWVKKPFQEVMATMGPLLFLFDTWGTKLKKLGGDSLNFRMAGEALMSVLTLIGKVLVYGVAFAFGVVVLAVKAVSAVIAGLIWVVSEATRFTTAFFGAMVELGSYLAGPMWSDIIEMGGNFLNWFMNLPERMRAVGEGIVVAIGEGLRNAWSGLAAMLLSLIHELPFGDKIADYFGLGGGSLSLTTPAGGGGGPARIGSAMAQGKASAVAAQRPIVTNNTTERLTSSTTILQLDGREMYRTMQEYAQDEDDRHSG